MHEQQRHALLASVLRRKKQWCEAFVARTFVEVDHRGALTIQRHYVRWKREVAALVAIRQKPLDCIVMSVGGRRHQ
jgi:hypothetical protein